jgi:hypothetical protein
VVVVTVFKTGFECVPEVTAWSPKGVGVVRRRGFGTGSVNPAIPGFSLSHFSKTGCLRPLLADLYPQKTLENGHRSPTPDPRTAKSEKVRIGPGKPNPAPEHRIHI